MPPKTEECSSVAGSGAQAATLRSTVTAARFDRLSACLRLLCSLLRFGCGLRAVRSHLELRALLHSVPNESNHRVEKSDIRTLDRATPTSPSALELTLRFRLPTIARTELFPPERDEHTLGMVDSSQPTSHADISSVL